MCDEKQIATKRCKSCGQLLPLSAFRTDPRSKDGHCHVCDACKAKGKDSNPKLAEFTPRELMEELACRGYHGKLTFVQKREITI